MGARVILDEVGESALNDASILDELKAASYGEDNRPAWIGAHRPTTTDANLRPLALWAAAHYAYYLTFVRDYIEKRVYMRILDIGCGAGQNTAMLARYAEFVTGIDSDKKGIAFAVKHNAGSGADFVWGEFPNQLTGSYDYIFCIETIEHVLYDKQIALIEAALGMLRDGGRMFITTPNETSPSGPHHGIWTPEWMRGIMEKFGTRVEKRGYFSNTAPGEGFVEAGTHHALVLR